MPSIFAEISLRQPANWRPEYSSLQTGSRRTRKGRYGVHGFPRCGRCGRRDRFCSQGSAAIFLAGVYCLRHRPRPGCDRFLVPSPLWPHPRPPWIHPFFISWARRESVPDHLPFPGDIGFFPALVLLCPFFLSSLGEPWNSGCFYTGWLWGGPPLALRKLEGLFFLGANPHLSNRSKIIFQQMGVYSIHERVGLVVASLIFPGPFCQVRTDAGLTHGL